MALNIKPLMSLEHPEVTHPKMVMDFRTKKDDSKTDNARKPNYYPKKQDRKEDSLLATALIRLNII